MLSTAIIVFREVFEIAIILSVVLIATRGLPGRWKWVTLGLGGGAAFSVLLAVFVEQIANAAEGMGQEIFNASVLYVAAAVIGWTVIWMKRHARAMTGKLKKVSTSVTEGELPFYSLSIVVFLAMLREGSEIVLLTHGLVAAGGSIASVFSGALLGGAGGAVAGVLFYLGMLKVSTRYLFTITSILLVLLAAGMAAQGTLFLIAADKLPSLASPLWDTSAFLPQGSFVGQFLHALLGYSDRPLGMQVVIFAAVLAVLSLGLYLAGKGQGQPKNSAKA